MSTGSISSIKSKPALPVEESNTLYDEQFDKLLAETKTLIDSLPVNKNEQNLEDLSLNLVQIFVHIFSDGSLQNWFKLQKFLVFLVEKKFTLSELSEQLEHYTYRMLFQLEFSSLEGAPKNFLTDTKSKIHKIFPKFAFVKLMSADSIIDYGYQKPRKSDSEVATKPEDKITQKIDTYNKYGGSHLYDPNEQKIREKLFKEKTGLGFRDFEDLVPLIALELASEETQNLSQLDKIHSSLFGAKLTQDKEPYCDTGRIMDLDLYKVPKELKTPASKFKAKETSTVKKKVAPEYNLRSIPESDMNGVTHAQQLIQANHLKVARFVYLKALSPKDPYTLGLIPKVQAKGEHYLMSNFGVLRVADDGFVESLSLADWHREALIFKSLQKLTFFKTMRLKKAFNTWRRGVAFTKMTKVKLFLEDRLLPANPSFNIAYCHLHKLLMEMESVGILPLEKEVNTFTISDYEAFIETKKQHMQTVLKKFFNYAGIIVNTTRDKILDRMALAEQKLGTRPKPHTKASLSQQRAHDDENQRKLLLARKEALLLGNFVQLFEVYVAENLLAFTRKDLSMTTDAVLELMKLTNLPEKDKLEVKSFFLIDLTFDESCQPQVDPSMEYITTVSLDSLSTIISLIARSSYSFGATINPMLDSARGIPPKRPFKSGSKKEVLLHRPSASLVQEFDELSVFSTSQMSEQLLNLSAGSGPEIIADGFIGQFDVLSTADLQKKFDDDEVVINLKKTVAELWDSTGASIREYCEDNKWMVPICNFIKDLDCNGIDKILEKELAEIQGMLNQAKSWIEQLESTIDTEWKTPNLVLTVRQDTVHVYVIPRLQEFIDNVSDSLSQKAMSTCSDLVREIDLMREFIRGSQDMGIAIFASYLSEVSRAKIQLTEAKPRKNYANSCLQTVKACVRALTSEEREAIAEVESKLAAAEEEQMAATEFVRNKKIEMEAKLQFEFNQKVDQLEQFLKECEAEEFTTLNRSVEISKQASANVRKLNDFQEKAIFILSQCEAEAKYKKTIQSNEGALGEFSLDIAGVNHTYKRIEARRELWKYIQVTESMMKEWHDYKFRLLKTAKVRTKLTQWQEAANVITNLVPQNDLVLEEFKKRIETMSKLLPSIEYIQKVCNDRKTWRQAVQKATQKEDMIDLSTVRELVKYRLTSENFSFLKTS